jgi:hypothetical protein
VDGTGMQKIKDEGVSKKILNKVNNMNVKMALISTAISIVYAAIPFSK